MHCSKRWPPGWKDQQRSKRTTPAPDFTIKQQNTAIKPVSLITLLLAFFSHELNASQATIALPDRPSSLAKLPGPLPSGFRHTFSGGMVGRPLIRTDHFAPHTNAALDSSAPAPTRVQVLITSRQFVPATVHIRAGDEVTWINYSATLRAVTSPHDGSLASDKLYPGSRFTHTFEQPGVYLYYCALQTVMFGRVVVE